MGLIARWAAALVVGVVLAIAGSIVGWFIAFSVPEGMAAIPFMAIMTGIGAGLGSYLGWHIDLDGSTSHSLITFVTAVIFGLVGAWLGLMYGQSDEGSRVWRYPVTQATVLGAVIGSNVPLLLWKLYRFRATSQGDSEAAPELNEYFRSLKRIGMGASARRRERQEPKEW